MKINVAYALQDKYFYMSLVSIHSLLKNNMSNEICLYILYDRTIENVDLNRFNIFKKYKNCKELNFIQVDKVKYSNYTNYTNILYIFDLISKTNLEKVVFISNLTLINDDIGDIYNTNIDDYYCASAENDGLLDMRDVINKDYYFSTYFTIFNLNKIRQEKLSPQAHQIVAKKLLSDTEIINIILDKCLEIPLEYGYAERWFLNINLLPHSNKFQEKYKQFAQHIIKPTIMYFSNRLPVDNGCGHSYRELWWKYAEETEIYDEIQEFREVNKYKLKSTTAINSFNYKWLLSRMFPYIKPYWFRILIGFSISIPLGLLDGITALALKPYMDYVVGGKSFEFVLFNHNIHISSLSMAWILPIGIILFAAAQGVLKYLNSYISAWVSRRITNDVKFDLFHRLVRMHPQFFDDNPSGIIISRYISDASTASSGIVGDLKSIITSLFGALGLIAVMIYSSWQLAFIGVLVLCIAFIPVALLRKRIRKASNENMVISGNITTNMNETYNGNKVMVAYGLQDRQENLFRNYVKEAFNINMSLTKRTAWMSPMMYQIASVGIAIVLGYGTYLINVGQMTAGSFASFVTSLLLLYKPIKSLGSTLTGLQSIFVAMGRIFELFDLVPAIQDKENPIECKGLEREITFENVYFEYVPNKPVLKNINLTIPKNETLAIVGNSGGGKSTLVNLINRFYDVKCGAVKYDGVDIKDFSLKSLRNSISMVFQDNFLYSGTIKENILMGKPNATKEELENAIKYAHLEKTIEEFPEGLDTMIGERGLTLSGGQRQRIAIARAMIRNAPIVILDEATSALDNESEAIVQKAMDNLMKNRTVFIIAHRLSTIKNADRIAVINEGELVELGNHDELMNIEDGQYKHLYEMQFKKQKTV